MRVTFFSFADTNTNVILGMLTFSNLRKPFYYKGLSSMKKTLTQKLIAATMLAAMLLLSAQLSFAGPVGGSFGNGGGEAPQGKLSWMP